LKIKKLDQGNEYTTDAVIIGAGPVGLFAVFELGLLDIKSHLIDILDNPGGQCTELYPEKPIYDIPGIPKVSGQGLTDELLKQIAPFDPSFHLSQMAESLYQNENKEWVLETNEKTKITAKVVIIAAGGGSFVPKKPPITNIEKYEQLGFVKYSLKKLDEYKNKNILITGGGDSALDWTNILAPIANKVTLVHRREEFRAAPDSVSKMHKFRDERKVDLKIGQVKELKGQNKLEEVTIESIGGENKFNIHTDYLMPFFGLTMKLGPIANFGLNLDRNLITVDTEKFETNIKRIFAIGDINFYPGKLKLILSGFHEAALMSQEAFKYIFPEKKLRFQYTTTSSSLQNKLGIK
tara:strand:+ start:194 stop:1246 length:1053 start_codon:yes stop_codon:yes gene_type:complete